MTHEITPEKRRANVRLALIIGAVAVGFYVGIMVLVANGGV